MGRVLLIGLDGAPPALLFKWAKAGLLPNIAGLMAEGAYGPLRSTIPPTTCPAWTSSVTGVDVHKHGIYDFFLSADLAGRKMVFADSTKRKAKALWNILSASDKEVVVLNMPVTYPPEEIQGAMVTGMLTPGPKSRFTYPPGLRRELLDMGYIIDIGETMLAKTALFKRDPKAFLSEVVDMVGKRLEAAKYLMRSFDWDLFIVVFVALDRVNHLFWRFLDPRHIAYDKIAARSLVPLIARCYRAVDKAVGELVKEAGPDVDILIYSDHGFRPLNYFMFTNNLLMRRRLLSLKTKFGREGRALMTHEFLLRVFRRLPTSVITRLSGLRLRRLGHMVRAAPGMFTIFDLDPDNTLAFQLGSFIHLNERALDSEEERRSTVRAVLDALRAIYPLTHVKAHAKEEIFGRGARLPAVVLLSEGDVTAKHIITAQAEVIRRYRDDVEVPSLMWCGDHALHGTLIMAGPGVKPQGQLEGARIMDVAPTVLKLLGEEIPDYMDGKPLT